MTITNYAVSIALFSSLSYGCAPAAAPDTDQRYHALGGGWLSNNSAQAFGGTLNAEPIRGIFYSTTPPEGTDPSGTGWWVRSQNTDYYAPIDSITYNGQVVTALTAAEGFFSVTAADVSEVVSGRFDLQFQVGGSAQVVLRLKSTVPGVAYGKYEATWQAAGDKSWSSFCPHAYQNGDGTIIQLTEYMIPVGGAKWQIDGSRVDDPDSIQLACTHDAIGGCINWGYAPWEYQGGMLLQAHHQACTRMKRADFCGSGDPVTTTNQSDYLHTPIELWDSLSIHAVGAQTATTMEAFWNENGATCFNPSQYRSTLPNYVAHMQVQTATCPKPACSKSSQGLMASARPCTAIDSATKTCIQN